MSATDQAPAIDRPDGESGARRATLASRVREQLVRLIERGEFPRNCKLPTEAELCARFGVSRPVIRAALAALRDQNYVRSVQGSGSHVIRGPEPGAPRYPPVRTVADLERCFEFRITVEAQTAALAALRHTPETLTLIEDALREADQAIALRTPELAADLNFKFHRAVARATGNPFFVATLDSIPNLIGHGPVEVRNFGIADPIERIRAIGAEHDSLYRAIRARDAQRARAEMEAHIGGARQHLFERQRVG
jgi:GntR family transcriptional regulator, transcriptional repressor for pyruvate dehydrogenase complex